MIDLLFETSWEVCNKVGGIYAVLSTKAQTLHKQYKDNLIFIGPDVWTADKPSPSFVETQTPLSPWAAGAALPHGLKVRTGRWDVPGRPLAVLVSFDALYPVKNEEYAAMWERYRVDSLHAYGDYDEACMFALAAAMVIESIVAFKGNPQNVVAHFDEWTTGMGLLHVQAALPQVATVFTTHATSIGRSISGNGKPLYDYMPGYYGDQMAEELNMQSKHSLEKAAAHAADAFTTVSEVTARECLQLLERRPIVTPNAFEPNFVPKGAKLSRQRAAARRLMLRVAGSLTGAHFPDDTMIVATSGRLEMRNKGIDMFLDALSAMRTSFQRVVGVHRKVLALIMVPSWVQSPRDDLAANLSAGKPHRLFDPTITHRLHDPEHDPVYSRMGALGFLNEPQDMVTVIDVPCYLDGNDGIFNMGYYDLLPGLDAAVFPSYYEPWGYTPLESASFGVPTITTDLAGFGQWVLDSHGSDPVKTGVNVIHRSDSNYTAATAAIIRALTGLYLMPHAAARKIARAARHTARDASWDNFIKHYDDAYSSALQAAHDRNNPEQ